MPVESVLLSIVCAGNPSHHLHHPRPAQAQGHPHRQGLGYVPCTRLEIKNQVAWQC